MLSAQVDGQCDKLVMIVGHQFITLTVNICVQYGGREALHRAGLSVAVETCIAFLRLISHSLLFCCARSQHKILYC